MLHARPCQFWRSRRNITPDAPAAGSIRRQGMLLGQPGGPKGRHPRDERPPLGRAYLGRDPDDGWDRLVRCSPLSAASLGDAGASGAAFPRWSVGTINGHQGIVHQPVNQCVHHRMHRPEGRAPTGGYAAPSEGAGLSGRRCRNVHFQRSNQIVIAGHARDGGGTIKPPPSVGARPSGR